ncbi:MULTISPECIES: hypothetical protein [unclassified Rhodococcus (in: high G+C Gram-positive bacteria)]|uniref:hypothetical protein n=1 Tax=unclassified Rhodococcus (in: high G+C Gram-positive bacteria) TaxID=192944 RepID=UPI00163ACB36|nr:MULTISPECIES: hypothetical protein [unclassified Rhodococcus (in: high G+C Gram-positive bacteria)]MBC2642294.1 hypothetical protein [Rhodococcus sp. 3A]MBC2892963.1 hypothetical protein [Rhodococcus sp. 4CII]
MSSTIGDQTGHVAGSRAIDPTSRVVHSCPRLYAAGHTDPGPDELATTYAR